MLRKSFWHLVLRGIWVVLPDAPRHRHSTTGKQTAACQRSWDRARLRFLSVRMIYLDCSVVATPRLVRLRFSATVE